MTLTHEDKVELADGLRQIITWTMNSKQHRWTIQSRETTLNQMWKMTREYERENNIR